MSFTPMVDTEGILQRTKLTRENIGNVLRSTSYFFETKLTKFKVFA